MSKAEHAVSTQVTDATLERVEEYADELGATQEEAVRDRLRAGLDAADAIPGVHVTYGTLVGALGALLVVAEYGSVPGSYGLLGLTLLALALLHDALQYVDRR